MASIKKDFIIQKSIMFACSEKKRNKGKVTCEVSANSWKKSLEGVEIASIYCFKRFPLQLQPSFTDEGVLSLQEASYPSKTQVRKFFSRSSFEKLWEIDDQIEGVRPIRVEKLILLEFAYRSCAKNEHTTPIGCVERLEYNHKVFFPYPCLGKTGFERLLLIICRMISQTTRASLQMLWKREPVSRQK